MCPCSAADNTIDISAPPPPSLPGIGSIFAPIQIPIPELDLPTDLLEDLLALMEQLGALFPSGLFKANPDFSMKNVLDFIADILSQLAPFLSFYNFIMSLLNLIICIIEVLCAIPNPFAVASKLKKLFSECLPPFLNLFPWLALLAMILALLLLILALILYIIEQILAIIAGIIRNILIFTDAVTLQDAESVVQAANKIAILLCSIENLMALFLAIAAILAIIKALASFAGGGICDDDDTEGCCPPEICPPFIRDNKEILVTATGQLRYYSEIALDVSGIPGIGAALASSMSSQMASLREERWQLFDTNDSPTIPIQLIITQTTPVFFGGQIFYPDQEYPADTLPGRAPYTVDLDMAIDPGVFHPTDVNGERTMIVKDTIVVRKPYVGVIPFNGNLPVSNGTTGTFNLEGGLVFEEDGVTPFLVDGTQATLNTFIHQDAALSASFPASDDGYNVVDVTFTWKPQHPVLAGNSLITTGCFPEVSLEKAVQNSLILSEGTASILARLPAIGDLGGDVTDAVQCVQDAVTKFRAGINTNTATVFQAEVETCLNDLATKITDVYCDSLIEGASQFKSSFSIDTNVQFTTRAIVLSVILRDAGGTVISNSIPDECLEDIIDKLEVTVTFGNASDFVYDSTNGAFVSQITSDIGGTGEIQVLFDGQVISVLIVSLDFDTPSSVEEVSLPYTFVEAPSDKAVDRDATDIARDGN